MLADACKGVRRTPARLGIVRSVPCGIDDQLWGEKRVNTDLWEPLPEEYERDLLLNADKENACGSQYFSGSLQRIARSLVCLFSWLVGVFYGGGVFVLFCGG